MRVVLVPHEHAHRPLVHATKAFSRRWNVDRCTSCRYLVFKALARCFSLQKFSRRVAAYHRHIYGQIANGFYFQLFFFHEKTFRTPKEKKKTVEGTLNFVLLAEYLSRYFSLRVNRARFLYYYNPIIDINRILRVFNCIYRGDFRGNVTRFHVMMTMW